MPTVRIPLIGSVTKRSSAVADDFTSGKDQALTNVHLQVFRNSITGKEMARIKSRAKFVDQAYPGGTGGGTAIKFFNYVTPSILSAYGSSNSTIYEDGLTVGTISGVARFIDEAITPTLYGAPAGINNIAAALIVANNNAYYRPLGAGYGDSISFTGDLNSSTLITNIASTYGMYPGQTVAHANIPVGSYIESVDSLTQITISAAATATSASQTITRTAIAKIRDADFPGNTGSGNFALRGRFVYMDGYAFIMTAGGRIYHSDLNSLSAWSANSWIAMQHQPANGMGLARIGEYILAAGRDSMEFFYNAGNAAGSVLSPVQNGVVNAGIPYYNEGQMIEFNGTVAFIGHVGGDYGVYVFNGMTPRKISSRAISELVGAYKGILILNAMSWYGSLRLVLTKTTSTRGHYAWDPETDTWEILDFSGETELYRSTIGAPQSTGATCYYVGPDSGNIWANTGTACPALTVKTGRVDFGSPKYKTMTKLRLVGESATDVTANISWYDDDYTTQSSVRSVTLGNGKTAPQLHRCGSRFQRRAFLIEVAAPTESTNLEAIEVDYTEHSF